MRTLRVFLAEDHTVVREGLKLLVNGQPDMVVVGEAGTGREAVEKARELLPDVVVMDLSMPDGNGVEATERLRRACPGVKVMALTVEEDESYVHRLLQAGASGYVLKRAAAEELTQAIRTVAAGGVHLSPTGSGRVVGAYAAQADPPDESAAPLSERETEVLRLLAAGYSNKEIAAALLIGIKSVETYKARLMEKLGLRSRAEIVRYALRRGWLQPG